MILNNIIIGQTLSEAPFDRLRATVLGGLNLIMLYRRDADSCPKLISRALF
jgi:hypothetical protein